MKNEAENKKNRNNFSYTMHTIASFQFHYTALIKHLKNFLFALSISSVPKFFVEYYNILKFVLLRRENVP